MRHAAARKVATIEYLVLDGPCKPFFFRRLDPLLLTTFRMILRYPGLFLDQAEGNCSVINYQLLPICSRENTFPTSSSRTTCTPRSIREPPLTRVAETRFTINDSKIPPAGVLLLTPDRKITNLEKSSTNSLLYLEPRGDASRTNETRTIPLTRPLDDELYQLILGVEVRILVQKGASEIRTIRTHRGRALDSINPV